MTPVRFPLKDIHVPELAPEHCSIAVPFQHPTTSVPRRIWSLAFAASGLPARSLTTMVYRHGVSTRGVVEVVDIDARTGFVGVVAALAEATTARAAASTRRSRRMSLILGTDLHEAARADFPRAEGGRGRREPRS